MLGYLRLVRLPNAATAIADILAGYVMLHAGGIAAYGEWALLGGASACLYLSGMAFNDIADRKEDAEVRPNRPIPSGQVSLGGAMVCGTALMLLGVILAWQVHPQSMVCAMVLAVAILHYDFGAKGRFIAGPAVLGFCRFLNFELGMSAVTPAGVSFLTNPWMPAASVAVYAAGLTAFSAQEEAGKQARAIVAGALLCGAGIVMAFVSAPQPLAAAALGPLLLILVYRTIMLKKTGTPLAARNLVRSGVMGICLLDAGMILGALGVSGAPIALLCVALLIPAKITAKLLAQKEA